MEQVHQLVIAENGSAVCSAPDFYSQSGPWSQNASGDDETKHFAPSNTAAGANHHHSDGIPICNEFVRDSSNLPDESHETQVKSDHEDTAEQDEEEITPHENPDNDTFTMTGGISYVRREILLDKAVSLPPVIIRPPIQSEPGPDELINAETEVERLWSETRNVHRFIVDDEADIKIFLASKAEEEEFFSPKPEECPRSLDELLDSAGLTTDEFISLPLTLYQTDEGEYSIIPAINGDAYGPGKLIPMQLGIFLKRGLAGIAISQKLRAISEKLNGNNKSSENALDEDGMENTFEDAGLDPRTQAETCMELAVDSSEHMATNDEKSSIGFIEDLNLDLDLDLELTPPLSLVRSVSGERDNANENQREVDDSTSGSFRQDSSELFHKDSSELFHKNDIDNVRNPSEVQTAHNASDAPSSQTTQSRSEGYESNHCITESVSIFKVDASATSSETEGGSNFEPISANAKPEHEETVGYDDGEQSNKIEDVLTTVSTQHEDSRFRLEALLPGIRPEIVGPPSIQSAVAKNESNTSDVKSEHNGENVHQETITKRSNSEPLAAFAPTTSTNECVKDERVSETESSDDEHFSESERDKMHSDKESVVSRDGFNDTDVVAEQSMKATGADKANEEEPRRITPMFYDLFPSFAIPVRTSFFPGPVYMKPESPRPRNESPDAPVTPSKPQRSDQDANTGLNAPSPKKLRKRRCGTCPGCLIKSVCGECEGCKTNPRFGGDGRIRKACVKRICQNPVDPELLPEMTVERPERIIKPRRRRCGACAGCQLKVCGECSACKFRPKFGGDGSVRKGCEKRICQNPIIPEGPPKEERKKIKVVKPVETMTKKRRMQRCGACAGCQVKEVCGECNACKARPRFGGDGRTRKGCEIRVCSNPAYPDVSSDFVQERRTKKRLGKGLRPRKSAKRLRRESRPGRAKSSRTKIIVANVKLDLFVPRWFWQSLEGEHGAPIKRRLVALIRSFEQRMRSYIEYSNENGARIKSPFRLSANRDAFDFEAVPVVLSPQGVRPAKIEWCIHESDVTEHMLKTRKLKQIVDAGRPLYQLGCTTFVDVLSDSLLEEVEAETMQVFVNSRLRERTALRPETYQHTFVAKSGNASDGSVARTKMFFGARYLWNHTQLSSSSAKRAHGIRTDVERPPHYTTNLLLPELYRTGVLKPDAIINQVAINIYHTGTTGIAPHFDDDARFELPVTSIRIFSDSRLSFGCRGSWGISNGEFEIPMPRNSVLVLQDDSYASSVVKHCVRPCDMTGRSGVILFRKIHEELLQEAFEIELETANALFSKCNGGHDLRTYMEDLVNRVCDEAEEISSSLSESDFATSDEEAESELEAPFGSEHDVGNERVMVLERENGPSIMMRPEDID